MSDNCKHCRQGYFDGQRFGQDVECVNGILIDIDVYHDGWQRDTDYPVAPCHPAWKKQCAGKPFNNDTFDRLSAGEPGMTALAPGLWCAGEVS